jgi:hypothetical protein
VNFFRNLYFSPQVVGVCLWQEWMPVQPTTTHQRDRTMKRASQKFTVMHRMLDEVLARASELGLSKPKLEQRAGMRRNRIYHVLETRQPTVDELDDLARGVDMALVLRPIAEAESPPLTEQERTIVTIWRASGLALDAAAAAIQKAAVEVALQEAALVEVATKVVEAAEAPKTKRARKKLQPA